MTLMTRTTGTFLIAVVLTFSCAASVTAQLAPKIDACSLLTKAEIQAAIGQSVSDGKPDTKANPAVGIPCQYVVGAMGVFSIAAKTASANETPDAMMAALKKLNTPVSNAPGVGDRSFWADFGYGMLQLNTFKGGKYLLVTLMVPGATEAAQKSAAEKLMRQALTRI